MPMIGTSVTPGRSISQQMKLMPCCLRSPLEVRAKRKIQSACWAADVQILWPLSTNSSPSRLAENCSDARSEPEPGSL